MSLLIRFVFTLFPGEYRISNSPSVLPTHSQNGVVINEIVPTPAPILTIPHNHLDKGKGIITIETKQNRDMLKFPPGFSFGSSSTFEIGGPSNATSLEEEVIIIID